MRSSNVSPLIPDTVQYVSFEGDTIPLAVIGDEAFVPVSAVCRLLGVDLAYHQESILETAELVDDVVCVSLRDEAGGPAGALCLALEMLPALLMNLAPPMIPSAKLPKLRTYRKLCFRTLWYAHYGQPFGPPSLSGLGRLPAITERQAALFAARDAALAAAQLAEQQMIEESRLPIPEGVATTEYRPLNLQKPAFVELRDRFGASLHVEAKLTPQEIRELAQRVQDVLALSDRGKSSFDLFTELFRRFAVVSYDTMNRTQYKQTLDFLHNLNMDKAPS